MVITARLVLPADAVLQPANQLTEALRALIAADDGDFVLSRPSSRSLAKVMDGDAARLVRHFEKPSTIARAVAQYSRGETATADQVLESALPLLHSLLSEGLLVEAGSMESKVVEPSLVAHDEVDGWTVLRCVQALEDSEVYEVSGADGQLAAFKIGRLGNRRVAAALAWEAKVLRSASLAVTPSVLGQGEWKGRPWLALEWIAGADAGQACEELRISMDSGFRAALLRITGAILDAYDALHQRGIVHGDVHPRNILITPQGIAKIIDFGLAEVSPEPTSAGRSVRGGVSTFFEPELAKAFLDGSPAPKATFAGEQYALAAVLYFLLTGYHYLDFALERKQMLRQIVEAPMLPFAWHGIDPWPGAERVLARALDKDPTRFVSVSAFAAAWHAVAPLEDAPEAVTNTHLKAIRTGVLAQIATTESSRTWESLLPPTTSLNYGSAGIAYALYRMSCATGDPELLAWADVWITRAIKNEASAAAFYSEELGVTSDAVRKTSLYHGAAGVQFVQAMIAQARGDFALQGMATEAFVERSRDASAEIDLVLGEAGTLLGCTFLLDALQGQQASMSAAASEGTLRQFGNELVEQLWRTIDGRAAIQDVKEISNLGMSHGWAGLLYATLCWSAAAGQDPPPGFEERLTQLAGCAQPAGRGVRWKWNYDGTTLYVPNWCNGSAGYVFLWTAAHARFQEPSYLRLAEGAAWNAWENSGSEPSLCCGSAGQAYALMNLHRHTGEAAWLARARQRAHEAAAEASRGGIARSDARPLSLYKGNLGIALLKVELESPRQARMPAFERE